jgi:hypothetical protein
MTEELWIAEDDRDICPEVSTASSGSCGRRMAGMAVARMVECLSGGRSC